ncbi:hypothetical protein AVEN_197349-1 [Araneus ventricosus]|uniref:Uncharacterized protein n=1 Tax=Araneus ventricosus TaxID=182803 RepID=A0A4Y2RSE4_ARAVE|nr:hypothetical protein AVEN_197349-1 [Araneus ventricosus]
MSTPTRPTRRGVRYNPNVTSIKFSGDWDLVDSIEMENTEALLNALNHLRALSEVENDPKGSEDDEGDDRNDEELRLLISIVEKLIDLTWDKPNELTLSDLEELMVSTGMSLYLEYILLIGTYQSQQLTVFKYKVPKISQLIEILSNFYMKTIFASVMMKFIVSNSYKIRFLMENYGQ